MLAVSGGRLVCLSTPFGKRGFFFEEWQDGQNWERIKISAHECPRISEEFLEEEQQALGTYWYRQEYLCEFLEPEHCLYGLEKALIRAADTKVRAEGRDFTWLPSQDGWHLFG